VSTTWHADQPPPEKIRIGPIGWGLVALRGSVLGALIYGCLLVLVLTRLIERPLFGARRPVTPFISQFVCKSAFVILGIRFLRRGTPMREAGAVVANHTSWLDVFTMNAPQQVYFVAKSEVASWPAIGWLARATGAMFITRRGRDAKTQTRILAKRLGLGHKMLFFPEGTSTDGLRVLAFKSTLFAPFFENDMKNVLSVQPITVIYRAPAGTDPRFYGWWGEMTFAPHLLKILAARRRGAVEVVFHPPVRVADFADRKALAGHCEAVVRSALPAPAQIGAP